MNRILRSAVVLAGLASLVLASGARAEGQAKSEFYGFVMMDAGYNNKAVDPDWFDAQRPTKLESFKHEFGKDGSTFMSVRQTRFGVKSWFPTDMGELKTTFEFEMYGTGVDAGQTTIRLRHAYGELGKWGAGQYWSPFMDIDVFPNTLEYWGPNGMVFFRNVQIRYMPIQGDTRATIALERPGASADGGIHTDIIGGNVVGRFPLPDLSAEYRKAIKRGYVEVSGILRDIAWQDLSAGPVDLSDNVVGWGIHGSSNLKVGAADLLRLSVVYGEGIENYMNDAPVDVGTKANPGNVTKPIKGVALPVTGIVVFLDHTWATKSTTKMTSSIGYSMVNIDNSEGQAADAFKNGQYALANLLFEPAKNVMLGPEVGWIHRENKAGVSPGVGAYKIDDYHVQFSFKYNFSTHIGGM
ncbi:MAG: DcaP family trimeric outer membrane transporter [Candidatus Eiseniibacteriota bacterium]